MLLLADAVAVVHAAAVVLMVVGGLLALRWPRLLWVHLPVAGVIAAVYLVGADCPLTDLETALRGGQPFEGGFLGHYLLTPLRLDRSATWTQLGLLLTALVPNAAALVLATRRQHVGAGSRRPSGR